MPQDTLFAKQCIGEALIALMKEKEYQEITVTEICRVSGYSRMSYYRNFRSKDDILITYMKILADQFRKELMSRMPQHSSRSYEVLLFAFRYFGEYHRFVECLIGANLTSVLQYGLNYYMDTYLLGNEEGSTVRYALYYYAGGLFNLFTIWISGGMKETPEELAHLAYERMAKGTHPLNGRE